MFYVCERTGQQFLFKCTLLYMIWGMVMKFSVVLSVDWKKMLQQTWIWLSFGKHWHTLWLAVRFRPRAQSRQNCSQKITLWMPKNSMPAFAPGVSLPRDSIYGEEEAREQVVSWRGHCLGSRYGMRGNRHDRPVLPSCHRCNNKSWGCHLHGRYFEHANDAEQRGILIWSLE